MIDAKVGDGGLVAMQSEAFGERCPLDKASKKGLYG
jgi:hypothetical protein